MDVKRFVLRSLNLQKDVKPKFDAVLSKHVEGTQIIDIASAEHFKSVVTPDVLDITYNNKLDLYVDVHGCQEGFCFKDNSILNVSEIAKSMQLLNMSCNNQLFLFSGACYGDELHKMFNTDKYPIYKNLFAGTGEILDSDAYKAFLRYVELCKNGVARENAMKCCLQAIPNSFRNTFKIYGKTASPLSNGDFAKINSKVLESKSISKKI